MSSTKLNGRTSEQPINDLTKVFERYHKTIGFELEHLDRKLESLSSLFVKLCFVWVADCTFQIGIECYKIWMAS
jgi:hypothetical protein